MRMRNDTRLKQLLNKNNVTQQSFADMLCVTKYTAWKIINNKRPLRSDEIVKICRKFDVSANWLLGLNELSNPYDLERELSNSEKPKKSEIPTGSTVVDCISRKSVITIIQNHWWNCRDIDKLVNELPSVTPKGHWIPVNERLPEEGQFVIVSYPYDASDYSRKRVMTAWYHKEYGFTCGIADAWMPLPEPYRTGREE